MPFESLLIANRGEIAVRITLAARNLGIRTVAIFSEADAGALWTRLADEAHCIGPAPARESYLNIDKIVEVALASGASAIHPGYGLLSENPNFARAVGEAGIVFVGPRPETIATMGDKVAARAAAIAAGLPVLPGSGQPVADAREAAALAEEIGWPLAVKASFGGGGRGMRVANGPADLTAALEQAQRESAAAFGRSEVFLERFLQRPRHVEVQVLGDQHGNVIHLGDRDCSVQRRHQKLIEEAPAPNLPDTLRARIAEAAVVLSQSVGYEGAGTVEFLVAGNKSAFYFLEMNTRLQVEHGVSELVTGIDLVERQLAIAAGEEIGLRQAEVELRGHAIQARIAAEDPWNGFSPAAGLLTALTLPLAPWVRLDWGVAAGDRIEPHYDSMFGKILAWGPSRDAARRRIVSALDGLKVGGLPTTASYLRGVIEEVDFAAAEHDTGSVERDWQPDPGKRPANLVPAPSAAPGVSRSERVATMSWGGQRIAVSIFGVAASTDASAAAIGAARRTLEAESRSGGPEVRAPMDAAVVAVRVSPGDEVARGETLLTLEAMKMEMAVAAPTEGKVDRILVAAGQTVKGGTLLVTVVPRGETAE